MYIKLKKTETETTVAKYPYSHAELRVDNPNVSFPAQPSDEDLARFNAARVVATPRPAATMFGTPAEVTPELVNGQWTQRWEVKNCSSAEAEVRVRRTRNTALTATDWTQIPDAPLSAEQKLAWATYRQSMRDVSSQAGFPFDVQWPTAPK